MQNRPSLRAIQAFEAAARLGSFALAADELVVTPSAVSHLVKGVMPLGPNALRLQQGHKLVLLKSNADLPEIIAFQDWLFSELALTIAWERRMLEAMTGR